MSGAGEARAAGVVETVTVGALADEIDARAAQVACAQIMALLGGQFDWAVDTIEWVADAVRLVRPWSAPSFTDQDPAAVEFWAAVDAEATEAVTAPPGVAAVLVVVRDPDASTEVGAYTATGERVPLTEVVVDPGSGWSREDWNAARDEAIASVPAAVRDVVACAYAGQDRSEFISEGDGFGGQE